jgi:hypothetical protein
LPYFFFFALVSAKARKKSEHPTLHTSNMASNYLKVFEFQAHCPVFAPLLDLVKTVSASTKDAFRRRSPLTCRVQLWHLTHRRRDFRSKFTRRHKEPKCLITLV